MNERRSWPGFPRRRRTGGVCAGAGTAGPKLTYHRRVRLDGGVCVDATWRASPPGHVLEAATPLSLSLTLLMSWGRGRGLPSQRMAVAGGLLQSCSVGASLFLRSVKNELALLSGS